MPEPLKALSIRQPWAEQVLRGDKSVEYRSKPTKVRGRVYVYASLGRLGAGEEKGIEAEVGFPIDDLPRGLIVGTVEIVDCTGGDGEYEWQLANPVRLAEPLQPKEQPQPVWFHPFGRPDDGSPALDEETAAANEQDDSLAGPTTARFSPVIAACKKPFTAYHSKYLAPSHRARRDRRVKDARRFGGGVGVPLITLPRNKSRQCWGSRYG